MGWIAAGLAGLVAAVAAVVAVLLRRRLRRAETEGAAAADLAARLRAALLSGRMGAYFWPRDGGRELASPDLGALLSIPAERPIAFADVLAGFDDDSQRALDAAVAPLRERGSDFEIALRTRAGDGVIHAMGLAAASAGRFDLLLLHDVTESAAEISHLSDRWERLRRVLDALPVPVWCRNVALEIIDCNAAYAHAVDAASPEAAIAESREITGGGPPPARSLAEQARASGETRTGTYRVVIDGARRMLDITESPLGQGEVSVGFALDQTGLAEARTELARHVAAHADVLEHLGTAIVIYGPDRRVKFFNSAFAKLWHLDEPTLATQPEMGEVLEMLRERRLLPETADFPAFKRDEIKRFTSLIDPHEDLIHLPNGTAIRRVISPHPMGGLLFTFEDVTDRLALERSYNTLIAVQRETIDNMYEAIAVFGGDGRLKLYNSVFAETWGLDEAMLSNEPHIAQIIDATRSYYDGEWDQVRSAIISRVTGREERTGTFERTDGLVFEYGFLPLPDGGMLVRNLDITDSTRVQRALAERNEALEQADRVKSEFIANVSYELRTPLNTIIGFAEILNNRYFGALNTRQAEYSEGILEASKRLLSLINDILDLASIEAGRMELEQGTVEIPALIENVYQLTREWAREQQLNLHHDCPADIGVITGDERRLKHALFNLVSNAVKFTPPGGDITISAERDGENVLLSVTDTGIGIAKHDHQRIFEKFVRGKDPTGRAVGAGLGLALVQKLIELHGGEVSLKSTPHKGTTVTCKLPAKAGAAVGAAPLQRAAAPRPDGGAHAGSMPSR
ncbi:MAG TPA: ATP-binding protein [Alphaproteobacteria bacterium]|nr:ATP-binding protein [Alphaproteobacteria bacterium]